MRIHRHRLKVFLVLLFPLCRAHAQTAPHLQQILQRLDRLEGENRELREQLRQLREQISPGAPAAAQTPTPEERVDIEERRTAEQAQTKVESSQHFPLRVTGTALVNAFNNSKQNGGVDYPTSVRRGSRKTPDNFLPGYSADIADCIFEKARLEAHPELQWRLRRGRWLHRALWRPAPVFRDLHRRNRRVVEDW